MRFFLIGFITLSVAGCALPIPLQFASWAASGISYMATGKSVSDHAVSAVASRDCAMHRILFGEELCIDVIDETEGSAIVLAAKEHSPANPAERLRASLITLADSQDDGLQPASGPATTAGIPPVNTVAPLNNALLAVAETISNLKPAEKTQGSGALLDSAKHYLLIGQFQQLSDAQEIRNRHASLHTAIRMVLDEGNLLFQVTAGPFTRPDAQEIGATIATNGNPPEIALLCSDRTTQAPCDGRQNQFTAQLR